MTAIPVALTALTAAFANAPALAGVRVNDGPWLMDPSDLDIIEVGSSRTPGVPAVTLIQSPVGLRSTGDVFDVVSTASSYSGDDNISACRARADTLFDGIRAVLLTDQTLGVPAVSWAQLTSCTVTQTWKPEVGCEVSIEFVIRVQSFCIP